VSISELTRLLATFKDMLPAALGEPYFVNTWEKPYVFVAFYSAKAHEMNDDRVINGNEFRLWKPSVGFQQPSPLAGIIGIEEPSCDLVLNALTEQGTRAKDLAPYGSMIREMMAHIATSRIGEWESNAQI
jgi:hypothetical protein